MTQSQRVKSFHLGHRTAELLSGSVAGLGISTCQAPSVRISLTDLIRGDKCTVREKEENPQKISSFDNPCSLEQGLRGRTPGCVDLR